MATILLEYDAMNSAAIKGLEFLLSSGIFKAKETSQKAKSTEFSFYDLNEVTKNAFADADAGKTYKTKDLNDLFKQLEI